ncbi:MAG: cyanophycinase [Deltaproteobacteria bacterium]|nr:cyanophycinase [Deltaproteobacteria bacterium]
MPSPELTPGARGAIIPIGGAEDKLHNRKILHRFVEVSGGEAAKIAIIPTASELDSTGPRYQKLFKRIGVADAWVLDYRERADTDNPEWLARLGEATGIFMTGGNQLRLSTILGGTEVAMLMRRRNAAGVPIAGTSAGAAFLPEHMIAYGASGATPHAGAVSMAPGLGLTNRVIVDQHFRQRDRIGRLLTALAYNPFVVGFGLDEDTSAFIEGDRVEIVGAGAITVVDVSDLDHSGMASAKEGAPVDLIGVRLHVLTDGCSFDLATRRASPPPAVRREE